MNNIIRFTMEPTKKEIVLFNAEWRIMKDYLDGRQADQEFDRSLVRAFDWSKSTIKTLLGMVKGGV